MGYTKGEWKLREIKDGDEDEVHFIGHTDEYQIMDKKGIECIAVMGTGWASGKAKANAQLISATPRMYEALKLLRGYSEMVDNALKKAEGK